MNRNKNDIIKILARERRQWAMQYLVTSLVKASYVNPKATKKARAWQKLTPNALPSGNSATTHKENLGVASALGGGKSSQPRAKVTPIRSSATMVVF